MASRRKAREFALQALYHWDVGEGSVQDALQGLWAGLVEETEAELGKRQAESEEVEFATTLAVGVFENLEQLDKLIETSSTNWRVPRMSAIDRNILRMGCFELAHMPSVPGNVTINEAIELAKTFGTKDSKGFVNGILDRIARDLGRV